MIEVKNNKNEMQVVSSKAKKAVDYAEKGYMCSQAIVMSFAKEFGLSPDMAAKISSGFAGGMAQGKTCGAVTGAVIVIGLKYGSGIIIDQYSKENCFLMTQEFFHRFVNRRKTVECSDILIMNNINPKDPEEMKNLREKKLCDKIIKDAAEILEELLLED